MSINVNQSAGSSVIKFVLIFPIECNKISWKKKYYFIRYLNIIFQQQWCCLCSMWCSLWCDFFYKIFYPFCGNNSPSSISSFWDYLSNLHNMQLGILLYRKHANVDWMHDYSSMLFLKVVHWLFYYLYICCCIIILNSQSTIWKNNKTFFCEVLLLFL